MDVTLGNVASTNLLTFAGPTQARTITFPDAAMTVARTDAANTFTGTQTLAGAATVGGTLGVTGTATFAGAATVGTTLGVTGTATFTGAATVGTTLGVTGATTLSSTLAVTGVATLSASAVAQLGVRTVPTAIAVDGAITIRPGTVYATKAGVLAATLAAPTPTTHDGIVIRLVATTANANTLTCPAGTLGGNAVATFGGAINDYIEVEAYQGVWYPVGEKNITYS